MLVNTYTYCIKCINVGKQKFVGPLEIKFAAGMLYSNN